MMKLPCASTTPELVLRVISISQRWQISYWDSAILAAAESLGVRTVYSEDLSDGQEYEGIRVIESVPPMNAKAPGRHSARFGSSTGSTRRSLETALPLWSSASDGRTLLRPRGNDDPRTSTAWVRRPRFDPSGIKAQLPFTAWPIARIRTS